MPCCQLSKACKLDGWDGDGWTGGNEKMDESHEGVKEPLLRRRADGRGGGGRESRGGGPTRYLNGRM